MIEYGIAMKISRNRVFIFTLIASVVLNLAQWLALYSFIPQPSADTFSTVILHYNIYFGVDLIGEWYKIFYIPATGLAVMIGNILLAAIIYKREVFLAMVLSVSTLVLQIVLAVASTLTIISNLP